MKKFCFLTAMTVAAITTACSGNGDSEGLDFETVKATKTISISSEAGAPQCSVDLQLPMAKGEPKERAEAINAAVALRLLDMEGLTLAQAADSFANKYTNDYRRNFAPLYREDRGDAEKRAWYEYHYNIKGEAKSGREGVTVYTATIDYYEGGAHGINQLITMNFEAKTGRQLTLDDIFVPGYEQHLKEVLLDALKAKTGCKTMRALRDKGYLYSMEMFPSENFILGNETITFVYNPYEIAPYAVGSTELIIPFGDVKDLLKNSFEY